MEFLSYVIPFIIVIAVLVLIHEFGHFIAARMSGMRTDIFAFGMGYRLFGFNKKTGFTFGKLPDDFDGGGFCDYRVCLFPIGGYVKIAGMVDESMDTKFLASEPMPWEFRSKNTFQKIFAISAGVIMNTILAIGIFAGIIFFQGKEKLITTTINYIEPKSLGDKIGFIQGDKVIEINGKKVNNWQEVVEGLTLKDLGNKKEIRIIRNGHETDLKIEGKTSLKTIVGELPLGISHGNELVFIKDVETLSPAGKLGLKENDTLKSINREQITSFPQLTSILGKNKEKKILLEWSRNGKIMADSVAPNADGKLGFVPGIHYSGLTQIQNYSLFQAVAFGWNETVHSVELFIRSIIQIFKGNISAKQSLGGPIMIAKVRQ